MLPLVRRFRDSHLAEKVIRHIEDLAKGERFRIVHVCGTHEDTITKYGIRDMLPENIEVIMGPGCPVCTVPPNKIDFAIRIAENNVTLTTFGDMMRVPSRYGSLADANARGADVRIVYSIHDSIKIAEKSDKQVVHFAIGFETTAPTTAAEILANPPKNFSVYSAHLLIPPAMMYLLEAGEAQISGFILPGHVSTIIGSAGYRAVAERFKIPQIVAGFEPLDILFSISMILQQTIDGRGEVENEYSRAVRWEGNPKAQRMMAQVFDKVNGTWRGIGVIKDSGLALKSEFEEYDASKRFEVDIEEDYAMPKGCRCDEVLRAIIYPWDCPLYNSSCTPDNPLGPCMVSHEGSCYISARYGALGRRRR